MSLPQDPINREDQTFLEETNASLAQAVERERLLSIGRLTAAIVHEINNPLQALRGGLLLAQEDVQDPAAVGEYLELCLRESERICRFTQLISEIYRPGKPAADRFALRELVDQVCLITYDEFNRLGLEVCNQVDPSIALAGLNFDRLRLALLSLLLDLGSAVNPSARNPRLEIHAFRSPKGLSIHLDLAPGAQTTAGAARWDFPTAVLREAGGTIFARSEGARLIVRLDLPAAVAAGQGEA